jgi:hypothetical protein
MRNKCGERGGKRRDEGGGNVAVPVQPSLPAQASSCKRY